MNELPLALTVGVFDGLHLGHQKLVRRVCAQAGCEPAVVTFAQNPAAVMRPDVFPGDLFSLDEKLALLRALGVSLVALIDFSRDFSTIRGRDFLAALLGGRKVAFVALGENFRCGRGAETDALAARAFAGERGTEVWIAEPVMDDGLPISSSRIRRALAEGRTDEAERLLGRPYSARG
ncbi:MAG: FAD synthetase family protein [Treponema sp.]|nr:FAD synthetase family protein [Treponema sp.]